MRPGKGSSGSTRTSIARLNAAKTGGARAMARTVHRRILTDDGALPHFARASQNITAATTLLHGLPEAVTSEDRRARREIRTLLERAAAQQAKSLLSRRREPDTSQCAPSVHPTKDASIHQTSPAGRAALRRPSTSTPRPWPRRTHHHRCSETCPRRRWRSSTPRLSSSTW